jgi:hypothetical protein
VSLTSHSNTQTRDTRPRVRSSQLHNRPPLRLPAITLIQASPNACSLGNVFGAAEADIPDCHRGDAATTKPRGVLNRGIPHRTVSRRIGFSHDAIRIWCRKFQRRVCKTAPSWPEPSRRHVAFSMRSSVPSNVLCDRSIRMLMAARHDLLWIHAGVVCLPGHAVVLAAPSGQGKSTMVGASRTTG